MRRKIRFDEQKAIDPVVVSELSDRSDGCARRLLGWQIGLIPVARHTSTRHAAKRVAAAMLEQRSGSVIAGGSFCDEEELGCGESLDEVHGAMAKRETSWVIGKRISI